MSTKTDQKDEKSKAPDDKKEAKLQADTIGFSDPNEDVETREARIKKQGKQGPTVEPVDSAGTPVFDRSSQRTGEVFESGDVVFFREGPAGDIKPMPKHEAETRLVEIKKSSSIFRDNRTVTSLELAGGDKVTIDGTLVIVTPKEGPAETGGPSLNVHHADTQG